MGCAAVPTGVAATAQAGTAAATRRRAHWAAGRSCSSALSAPRQPVRTSGQSPAGQPAVNCSSSHTSTVEHEVSGQSGQLTPMPPMTTMAEVSARPRNTNFSIAAIMSENKDKESIDEDEELEVGTEGMDEVVETSLEVEEKIFTKKERRSKLMGKSNCSELDSIKCTLDNKELWDKFAEFGTEMIITRTGRRMFPTVRCSFSSLDLDPSAKYLVLLDIVPLDNKRYRYAYHRSAWLVAGKADPAPPHRLYQHPDAPFSADQLKKQVISFEKVKVTNNESDNTNQVIIISIYVKNLVQIKDFNCLATLLLC